MERLSVLEPLQHQIVNFAAHVLESQRPRLADGSAGDGLEHPFDESFRNERVLIPRMIQYWASHLAQSVQQGLESSQISQTDCSELQEWSKYADLFYSAYPLVLHDPKAALKILASKESACFWYYFWSWSSECEEESFETFALIEYLCHEVVPELCYMPQQAQARDEAFERIKSMLRINEMRGLGMSMALQASGLSLSMPPH